MTNLDARFKLGLVSAEAYLEHKEALAKARALTPGQLQSIIDKAADYIEFGLDKMGDGITLPTEKIIAACSVMFKKVSRRAKKRNLI